MLKTILLRKKLNGKRAEESAARSKLDAFLTREEELAAAIEAAETDEEVAKVEEAVEELEKNQKTAKEVLENIQNEIKDLLKQIEEAEAAQEEALADEGAQADEAEDNNGEERSRRRGETRAMNKRMDIRAAAEFQRTGKHTYKDPRSLLRAAVKSDSAGVVGPTGVGGINDMIDVPSSLIDMIKITDCTGMASYKVAYLAAHTGDAAAITEGNAPAEAEPTFGAVTLTPTNFGTLGYVSKEIRKQSPLRYEEVVFNEARRALRQKLSAEAVDAILNSTLNDTHAIVLPSNGTAADAFDANLLSNIILAYGGDEGVEGNAVLFLSKEDLKAFAAVRGTNEFLPVYNIIPDAANPNTGVIKDNAGLACRYCLNKNVTALSGLALTTTAKKTMFYGNPQCAEMGLWGGFDVETSDGYKFAEGLITVRGEVSGDVDVTVKGGFVVVTAKKSS